MFHKVSDKTRGFQKSMIQSRVTYTLPANVENLLLTPYLNVNATGNSLNNVLTGNSGNNRVST